MPADFVPRREADLVQYGLNFKTRIGATPTVFSLTALQATQFGTLYDTFVSAFNIAKSDATNSRSATITKNAAKSAMIANLRLLAAIVQKAPTTTDTMRSDLGLTVPKIPSPPAEPGTPEKFKAELTALGALNLSWKCTNPTGGTMYQIFRAIDDGAVSYIGGAGGKKFVDQTVPTGAAKVTYQIQAQRSTAAGAWATFDVKFGMSPSGSAVQSVTQSAVKLAA